MSYTPDRLAAKIRAGRGALAGERKLVTVLFADVKDSMGLQQELGDPEVWSGIVARFFSILCEGVHRYEGTVDKFTGDGIMAIFGAPIAHEDHARRACHTALDLQTALATFSAELQREIGLTFAVRIGLNSGEVVVGTIGDNLEMAYTAVGSTVGLGQRMEALADPGSIYLTEHTARLVDGYFDVQDLGEFQVKGGGALHVHELRGPGTALGSLDVSRARGFSPFVGRERVMGELQGELEQGLEGPGRVIGIVGEAGIGKSRLCHELTELCRSQGIPVFHLAGQPHARSVPLMPVLGLLRDYFKISDHDPDEVARERIADTLLSLDESFSADLPLIFDFLAVADPDQPAPRMDFEARHRQLLGIMRRLGEAQSSHEPGLLLLEDLQWLDPASEAFLESQVETVARTRGLALVNFRPGYDAPWGSESYYRELPLEPLDSNGTEKLLRDLVGADPSLDGLVDRLGRRTGGNPFFIEELVTSLIESGSLQGEPGNYRLIASVEDVAVPASVRATLAARVDRLGQAEKAALQAAAVVGLEFSAAVLARVVDVERPALDASLRNLVSGGFAHEHRRDPELSYAFKHPLTQEVAYGSLLTGPRAVLHAAAARSIIDESPQRLDELAALVAGHWEAAGETLEATRWHARAGAWSGTTNPVQALEHWHQVRELAGDLPEGDETTALGLTARIFALQYGFRLNTSDAEARKLFTEAERMASAAGDLHSHAVLLFAYGAIRGFGSGDVVEFARLSREALALAERAGDPALYMALSPTTFALELIGEYREGVAVLDRALELAAGDPSVGAGINLGCPYAYCHCNKALILTWLGELEQAGQELERALTLATEYDDPETVGFSHFNSAFLAFFRGDEQAMYDHARESLRIAQRSGSALSRGWGWFYVGWANSVRQNWKEAVDALEHSSQISRESGTNLEADPLRTAVLGESYLGLGDAARAVELTTEAIDIARARGQTGYETYARLAFARVLLASQEAESEEIETALLGTLELAIEREAIVFKPLVHGELAELARRDGDEHRYQRELLEAHRLSDEMGAPARTRRLAAELASSGIRA